MVQKSQTYAEKHLRHERVREDGWTVIDLDSSQLRTSFEPPEIEVALTCAQLSVAKKSSRLRLFLSFFPPSFVDSMLETLKEDSPQVRDVFLWRGVLHLIDKLFVKKSGTTKGPTKRVIVRQMLYEAMAYGVVIQGAQEKSSEANPTKYPLEQRFKEAGALLAASVQEGVQILSYDLARRIYGGWCMRVGSSVETTLAENFRSVILAYGEVVACDEKVFEFNSAHSGMLRVIPAKHQKGLWNYTMCVTLSPDLPYLIDTRCATEISALDEHIKMTELMEYQTKIARLRPVGRNVFPCMVYDSYYGTVEGLQLMRKYQQPFIWCCNPQRFGDLVSLLDGSVRESGQSAFAVRKKDNARDREELLTCFWSRDGRKGKQYTITNYLKQVDHKRRPGHIPGAFEYQYNFASCDKYNRRLHDKSWPHRYAGGTISVEYRAGHDFLFTCALVNLHQLWKSLDFAERKTESFKQFTEALAKEIVASDMSAM